jgi:hypothetical protein
MTGLERDSSILVNGRTARNFFYGLRIHYMWNWESAKREEYTEFSLGYTNEINFNQRNFNVKSKIVDLHNVDLLN